MLLEVINFVFKYKVRKRIDFSETYIYCISKGAERRYFTKQILVNTMSFLINKCLFTIGNMVFIPRASDLFSRMIAQRGNKGTLTKQLKKAFRH